MKRLRSQRTVDISSDEDLFDDCDDTYMKKQHNEPATGNFKRIPGKSRLCKASTGHVTREDSQSIDSYSSNTVSDSSTSVFNEGESLRKIPGKRRLCKKNRPDISECNEDWDESFGLSKPCTGESNSQAAHTVTPDPTALEERDWHGELVKSLSKIDSKWTQAISDDDYNTIRQHLDPGRDGIGRGVIPTMQDIVVLCTLHGAVKCADLLLKRFTASRDSTSEEFLDFSEGSNPVLFQMLKASPKRTRRTSRFYICKEVPMSLLEIAICQGNIDMGNILCKYFPTYSCCILSSASEWFSDNPCVIFQLVRDNMVDMFQSIIITVDSSICNIESVIDPAVYRVRSKAVRHLLLSESDDESTVIHWAAEEGNVNFVKVLVQLMPDLSTVKDCMGVTPLHSSCLMGHLSVARTLLEVSGVDPDVQDESLWSPFIYAVYSQHVECALLVFRSSNLSAVRQLCNLGDALSQMGERIAQVFESLATVPDFFSLVNSVVRSNHHHLEGKLFFLIENPCLLDIDNKLAVGKKLLEYCTEFEYAECALTTLSCDEYVIPEEIILPRVHTWRSLVSALQEEDKDTSTGLLEKPSYLQKNVLFQFFGEEGIGIGVEREVFEKISADLCFSEEGGDNYALFSTVENNSMQTCVPISLSSKSTFSDDLPYFEFGELIGHLLLRRYRSSGVSDSAHAPLDSGLLSINIADCFWKLVFDEPISLHDVANVDCDLYKNLQWMLANSGAQDLDLSFTAADASGVVVNLVPGGDGIAVTDNNKSEYVDLLIEHTLVQKMRTAAEQTSAGIRRIVPQKCLDLLAVSDIGVLVTGVGAIDLDEWKNHTMYNGYAALDIVIKWFWEFVGEADSSSRGMLLRFVTGCTRLPPTGFTGIRPMFTIAKVPYCEAKALPTAATCFNLLRLPEYPSRHCLRKSLHTAIVHGSEGFTFS